jgi:hypothetical protein
MLSFDRWGDGGRPGVHYQVSASQVLKGSGNLLPYALQDDRRTCGRPSGTQYEASGVKPDRHIIKGLRFRISPTCTLSQNGYGDLRRRRLYMRWIRIPASTELRRCRRSGALRDDASSRSHCPHIYSTTQSASATASSWRFAPTSHASFCSRPRPSTCGFNLE